MDTRKQAIIDALRAFISKRPGFDPRNYGDATSYRADMRTATRQKHDAMQFLRDIELRDSISADDILKEAQSGRLAIRDLLTPIEVDYCAGQYWCTEYRGAVARLCASVLWTWKRDKAMPERIPGSGGYSIYEFKPTEESAGTWLRASFRREYGRTLAGRYFS